MKDPEIKIVTAAQARQALTEGDIREEIAFQNDINTLLACLEEKTPALRALAGPQPPVPMPGPGRARPRRLGRHRLGDGGAELLAQDEVVLADGEAEELPQRLVALRQLA